MVITRDYEPRDAAGILALWTATGVGAPARGDDAAVIARTLAQGGRLLVLEAPASRQIVGTAWITYDGRRLYLHHVAVEPGWQGRGLGEHLVREAVRFAAERGVQIKLEVHADNARAIRIYRRLGFGRLDGYELYIVREPRTASEG